MEEGKPHLLWALAGEGGGREGARSPTGGCGEDPREGIERLIREGKMSRADLERAERFWRERLQPGITMPNGQSVKVLLERLLHILIREPRVRQKIHRIELLLEGVYEIRTAAFSRRAAFSRWDEEGRSLVGHAILAPESESENQLVSLHVIEEKELRRMGRKGERVWPQ